MEGSVEKLQNKMKELLVQSVTKEKVVELTASYKTVLDNIKSNRTLKYPEELFIKEKNSLELVINKLELLNPLSVLSKGYSVATVDNKIIKSTKDVKINDNLNIRLLDGEINSIVKEVQ